MEADLKDFDFHKIQSISNLTEPIEPRAGTGLQAARALPFPAALLILAVNLHLFSTPVRRRSPVPLLQWLRDSPVL
jgi:hypothetical protein